MVLLQRLIGPMAPVDLDPLALTREQGATISRMLWAAADGIDIQPYVDMLIELADSHRN